MMKRLILAALVLVFAIGLLPQSARAQDTNAFWAWIMRGQDPRLFWGGVGIGIGTDIASYYLTKKRGMPPRAPMTFLAATAVTSYACAVVTPFVGTILLNRPLTPREMYDGVGDCIVPFIGGMIVDAMLPHDAWTDGTPPRPARHHK